MARFRSSIIRSLVAPIPQGERITATDDRYYLRRGNRKDSGAMLTMSGTKASLR